MFMYLLVGLLVMMCMMWGHVDYFFTEINQSVARTKHKWPELPTIVIKTIYSIVFIIFWLGWPVFVAYTLYKATKR